MTPCYNALHAKQIHIDTKSAIFEGELKPSLSSGLNNKQCLKPTESKMYIHKHMTNPSCNPYRHMYVCIHKSKMWATQ